MAKRNLKPRAVALACLWSLAAALGVGALSVVARPSQAEQRAYLPNVVSGGYTSTVGTLGSSVAGRGDSLAPLGIVGFGESTIEIQSLASRETLARLDVRSTSDFGDVATVRPIAAGGALALPLRNLQGITFSNYVATIAGEAPLGVLSRTRWSGGAEAVYEAPEPATRSILPMVARDVYSHTSVIWLQNTDEEAEAEVQLDLFGESGAPEGSWTYVLQPGSAGRIDLSYQNEFERLPINAANGYLGSFHVSSDTPVAVAAYGDEPQGRGTAALRARPLAAAEEVQLLPFVRAGTTGHSLIAIANASNQSVDVTVAYRGAPNSPAGAGQTVETELQIGPRAQAFVDLDSRLHRGNRPPPNLPRGGFVGSAVVRASGPVLTAVLDQTAGNTFDPSNGYPEILVSMAYNGFGGSELSAVHALPRVRYQSAGTTTELVLQNPGSAPVAVEIDLRTLGDPTTVRTEYVTIPPFDVVAWSVRLPAPGVAHAVLRSSAPIAALAVDVNPVADWTAYRAVPMPATLVDVPTPAPPPTFTATATREAPTTQPSPATPTGTAGPGLPATNYLPWVARRQ